MNERPVLVLTGASAGIGAALALRAARAGYAVVASGRNSEMLAAVAGRVTQEGGTIVTIVGDVRDSDTSTRIAEFADESFGRIDVLVANAGVAARGPLVLQSDEELEEQLETHVLAPVTLIRSCLPLLSRSKGTVFVIGSGVARMPIGGMGLYPASKSALRSAARTMRRELKFMGIGLTYVDPGAVDTDFMHRRSMPGAPKALLTSPHAVAKRILHNVARRPAELNVVTWQAALVGVAEFFPGITDFVLERAGAITGAPLIDPRLSRNDAIARLRGDRPLADGSAPVLRVVPNANATTKLSQITTADTGLPPITPSATAGASTSIGMPHSAPVPPKPVEHVASRPAAGNIAPSGTSAAYNPSPLPSGESAPAAPLPPRTRTAGARAPKADADEDPVSAALAPFATRMRRLNFSIDMLRNKFTAGKEINENELALDWVGMPNKNERKLINDMCQACAEAELVKPLSEGVWLVLRTATAATRK